MITKMSKENVENLSYLSGKNNSAMIKTEWH